MNDEKPWDKCVKIRLKRAAGVNTSAKRDRKRSQGLQVPEDTFKSISICGCPAGEVNLKVPKVRRQAFETAIIERYQRRECSVEETLIEMYLAGVSVRRVEDITEALWGTRVSPGTVSNLNKRFMRRSRHGATVPLRGSIPTFT